MDLVSASASALFGAQWWAFNIELWFSIFNFATYLPSSIDLEVMLRDWWYIKQQNLCLYRLSWTLCIKLSALTKSTTSLQAKCDYTLLCPWLTEMTIPITIYQCWLNILLHVSFLNKLLDWRSGLDCKPLLRQYFAHRKGALNGRGGLFQIARWSWPDIESHRSSHRPNVVSRFWPTFILCLPFNLLILQIK